MLEFSGLGYKIMILIMNNMFGYHLQFMLSRVWFIQIMLLDPWYAPAGTTRGKVSALDVEYSPSRTDRDLLYGDTNIVNPIVYFVGEGITIWGQKNWTKNTYINQ